jgi:hypothetical protein
VPACNLLHEVTVRCWGLIYKTPQLTSSYRGARRGGTAEAPCKFGTSPAGSAATLAFGG